MNDTETGIRGKNLRADSQVAFESESLDWIAMAIPLCAAQRPNLAESVTWSPAAG